MSASDRSPEFPSVGARARFTQNVHLASRQHDGQACELFEPIAEGNFWHWRVKFDDGHIMPVLASELSPLPAAPTIVEAK